MGVKWVWDGSYLQACEEFIRVLVLLDVHGTPVVVLEGEPEGPGVETARPPKA